MAGVELACRWIGMNALGELEQRSVSPLGGGHDHDHIVAGVAVLLHPYCGDRQDALGAPTEVPPYF